ncbi:hypothetical protein J4Q44_G00014020 [Coregonus suidteri]|uniref:Uncharacterized protein n=1 Tax=Coregonus suidteri TaxID=861788 RepID=A0AAN8ME61_9TELE
MGHRTQYVSVCLYKGEAGVSNVNAEPIAGCCGSGLAVIGRLCDGDAGLVVDLEHLLDGVDVRSRPQVQTQVVLTGRTHDLLQGEKTHKN